jgi:hypothetical protein
VTLKSKTSGTDDQRIVMCKTALRRTAYFGRFRLPYTDAYAHSAIAYTVWSIHCDGLFALCSNPKPDDYDSEENEVGLAGL